MKNIAHSPLFLLLLMIPLTAIATPTSIYQSTYTSTKKQHCKTLASYPDEAGYYQAKCPSFGGYSLEIEGQDMRNVINLTYANTTVSYRSSAPSTIGNMVEWRYRTQGKQKIYTALIHRFFVNQYNEKTGEWLPQDQDKQSLVVMRLAKQNSCVLGVIEQSATMNIEARKLADNMNAPCQKQLNHAD